MKPARETQSRHHVSAFGGDGSWPEDQAFGIFCHSTRGEKKSTAQPKSEGALKSNQPTIASVLKLDVNKPTEQNIANNIISRFNNQYFQRIPVELINSSNQSLSFAEKPILQEIFDYLNPSISIQRANLTARAVRYKIIQEYNRHRQNVIEVLRNSPGALHISFDGWTFRNKLALYGIACFFRDEKNRPCKIIIGVPEAHRHFGSTIGGDALDILHTLGVSSEKIGYFTLGNAENNNTVMEVIGAELGFDSRLYRGRCIGTIINLSAKALLFGINADAFEQQLSGAEVLSDTEYARWRKKGPVGKLHNILVDVRISHRLIYLFRHGSENLVQQRKNHSQNTKERNRIAASKFRTKKREHTLRVQSEEQELERTNHALSIYVANLTHEVQELKMKLLQHTGCDCSLIHEYLATEAQHYVCELSEQS